VPKAVGKAAKEMTKGGSSGAPENSGYRIVPHQGYQEVSAKENGPA
jgi:hypothetical protein